MTIGVIGGGIAGLSAALCLGRAGVDVQVFERAPEIREAGAGVSIWPNATRLLRDWGLLDRCVTLATPLSALEIRNRAGMVLLSTEMQGSDAPTLCMRRPELLSILESQVPAEAIHVQHACTSVRDVGGQMEVTFAQRPPQRFDAVIGADGWRSTVRKYVAGPASEPVARGYACWRGISPLELPGLSLGKMGETWGPGRRFGILPIERGTICWYATANQSMSIPEPSNPRALFEGWPEPVGALIRSTPPEALIRTDAWDLPPLSRWCRKAAVLIGDAAHAITPNLGQGSCLALEDASVLSRLLGEHRSTEATFEAFARLRKRRIERIVALSRWLGRVGQLEGGRIVQGRDRLVPLLGAPVFDRLVRRIHEWRDS